MDTPYKSSQLFNRINSICIFIQFVKNFFNKIVLCFYSIVFCKVIFISNHSSIYQLAQFSIPIILHTFLNSIDLDIRCRFELLTFFVMTIQGIKIIIT